MKRQQNDSIMTYEDNIEGNKEHRKSNRTFKRQLNNNNNKMTTMKNDTQGDKRQDRIQNQ